MRITSRLLHRKRHQHDDRDTSILLRLFEIAVILATRLEDVRLCCFFAANSLDVLHFQIGRRPLAAPV